MSKIEATLCTTFEVLSLVGRLPKSWWWNACQRHGECRTAYGAGGNFGLRQLVNGDQLCLLARRRREQRENAGAEEAQVHRTHRTSPSRSLPGNRIQIASKPLNPEMGPVKSDVLIER